MTILECRHQEPFEDGWSDWSAPERSVVVTFQTIKDSLYELWREQCLFTEEDNHKGGIERTIGMTVDHSEFNPDELQPPGIHRDNYHPDEPDLVTESYVIIVPNYRLHPEICDRWIKRLNTEYDRDFELMYSSDR
jgi:hypothetical protein